MPSAKNDARSRLFAKTINSESLALGLSSERSNYFFRGGVVSNAQIAAGRMYMEARYSPSSS
jgi:hypothetical protein